ncbi:MAG: sigma-70 family RNA polymerase sigma factor [Armatimonadetes bacterium]|nr:sigma-70 family RNA polymerase sigma factor [Armatimonadota bacterium]
MAYDSDTCPADDGAHGNGNNSAGYDRLYLGLPPLTRERLLTAAEERVLSAAVRNGDKNARVRMVEANMRLVISIAKRFHSPEIPFEDLVQEGAIGLMTACERFDPSRGYRFSTYATHWIRQAIGRAIDTKAHAVRIPSHVSDGIRKIERCRQDLVRELGQEPSLATLAQRAGMSQRRVSAYLRATQDPLSLDSLVGQEDQVRLGGLVSDPNALDPQDAVLDAELQREISEILESLSERERAVMRRRFGFDGDDGQVLRDIGTEFGISRERVRQIEASALRRVRAAARRRRLVEYLTP